MNIRRIVTRKKQIRLLALVIAGVGYLTLIGLLMRAAYALGANAPFFN